MGTGEANIRNDVVTGHGVYFSPDAGASWKFMGLDDVGQISTVIVHPTNPDMVFVAALGHAWAPESRPRRLSHHRWRQDLAKSSLRRRQDRRERPDDGPGNPMVLFAGMWEVRRYPWMLVNGGTGSAIYRSTDGGSTWKKLTEGLPERPLGRIGLAAAPSNPQSRLRAD